MIRIWGTTIAALLGLAFGSFLNVCVTRWPAGESVVKPRSHCRACGRTLTWWESIPLVSWLALRGRCRTCGVSISWRYTAVEAAVGGLWATLVWNSLPFLYSDIPPAVRMSHLAEMFGNLVFCWLLVALAAMDAGHFWLPNGWTLPGIGLGIADKFVIEFLLFHSPHPDNVSTTRFDLAIDAALGAVLAAGFILLIRFVYWLIRRREGLGLGDAKLMAMLGAWLGLASALLAFGIGILLAAVAAIVMLANRPKSESASSGAPTWAAQKLPLGTFLCIGGIVSLLWGDQIVDAYLHWAGF